VGATGFSTDRNHSDDLQETLPGKQTGTAATASSVNFGAEQSRLSYSIRLKGAGLMQTDERERDDTNVDYLDAHAGL